MSVVETVGANFTVTTATTPLCITLALMPDRMHVYRAAPLAHDIDLLAAVAALPSTALIERTSPAL
jgi:hypothetical protein